MDCSEVKENCSDYVDCCLGEKQDIIEAHLNECPHCRSEMTHLKYIVNTLNCLSEKETPPNFIVRLNERLDDIDRAWWSRLASTFAAKSYKQALAFASTAALIFLGLVFIGTSQKPPGPVAETDMRSMVAESPVGVLASPVRDSYSPGEGTPISSASLSRPVRTVSLGSSLSSMDHATRSVLSGASVPIPGFSGTSGSGSSSVTKAPYVDRIILLEAPQTSIAAEQVRAMARRVYGTQLDYSEKVIFVLVPPAFSDTFIQALETIGSVEVINGPIERGLPSTLFQVIVIPQR